jgi:hypothetical protein
MGKSLSHEKKLEWQENIRKQPESKLSIQNRKIARLMLKFLSWKLKKRFLMKKKMGGRLTLTHVRLKNIKMDLEIRLTKCVNFRTGLRLIFL